MQSAFGLIFCFSFSWRVVGVLISWEAAVRAFWLALLARVSGLASILSRASRQASLSRTLSRAERREGRLLQPQLRRHRRRLWRRVHGVVAAEAEAAEARRASGISEFRCASAACRRAG